MRPQSGNGTIVLIIVLAFLGVMLPGSAAGQPIGGRLVVAIQPAEPRTLNGAISTRIGDQVVAGQVCNALTPCLPAV